MPKSKYKPSQFKQKPPTKESTELVVKNKGGQPKKMLDEARLIEMASHDATVEEIGAELGCHRDTIYSRYSDTLKKGRLQGNISLKQRMFQLAMEGNVGLLVWLSKNRFGYRDKPEDEATNVTFNVLINEVPR